MDAEKLINLWKKGKTLYSSLFKYTVPSLLENYNQSQSEFENQTNQISEKNSDAGNSVIAGIQTIQESFSKYQGISSAENELKWDIINKILSEKLIGLGYESPIKSSDLPQIIPIHVWPEKITDFDWKESSFSNNGVEFLKIKLIKFNELKKEINSKNEKKEIKLPDIKVKDKVVGRPSIKDKIIEAYENLKTNGKIDFCKTLKSHTELIQQTVKTLTPDIVDNKGMQHEAIRRTIGDQFKADKNL